MADLVMNIAKGSFAYLATLPAASDALVVIPLEAAGLVADSVMIDYATVAAILAGASNEQTTMGRLTATGVTSTVDNANDRRVVDMADVTWALATGNAVGALIVAYDPDTGGGTDADLIPLFKFDFTATPDGNDLIAIVNAAGLSRAT